jgi:excinuclease ABC subunit C
MKKTDHIQSILERLPLKPGVYQHYDADGRLLYVGKAKELRKRVASYFTKQALDHGKTRLLVSKIADIKWLVTPTEADALLLENSLIKEHKPLYNIQLKDDKTYPYIVIKKEPFPRVFATRKLIRDGSEYFGPYPSARAMHVVLELCRKLYPIRTCSLALTPTNVHEGKFRECLEFHIGNCHAPCVGRQSEESYGEAVAAIRHILRGDLRSVERLLRERIEEEATAFRFEEAAGLKTRLDLVQKFQAKNTVVHPSIHDVDVFTVVSDARTSYVNFLKINNGSIVQGQTVEVRKRLGETDREVLEAAIPLLRDRFNSSSPVVFTHHEIEVPGVEIAVPLRGDKKRLIELSERNATYFMRDRQKQLEQVDPEAATSRLLETAAADLRLQELPRHIECFDNSNIQGTNPASACVVFKDGKPSKADYRKFNIKTVVGPDDFASMREVVYRRYHRLCEEGEPLPQLIIIDGGKGQLSHAVEALEELGLMGSIAIIGIAKRLEEIFFPGDSIPLYIDKRSSTLKLIQHLRNEAHRFSLSHHRDRRSKDALRSALDEVPGIGPATRQKLLTHFGSVEGVKGATEQALLEVVNLKVARAVRDHFKSD